MPASYVGPRYVEINWSDIDFYFNKIVVVK